MHLTILISGALITLLLTAAVVLLRTCFATCISYAESLDRADLSWRDYPVSRLLDTADFEYLRRRGVSEAQMKKLRTERRIIFRLCLRSLARDFNRVQYAINIMLVQAQQDRPDLAAELARQRFTFYRNLLLVEGWLVLHACGFDRMPTIDLLQPLQTMQAQLRLLGRPIAVGMSA